jgi:hypothetical protein
MLNPFSPDRRIYQSAIRSKKNIGFSIFRAGYMKRIVRFDAYTLQTCSARDREKWTFILIAFTAKPYRQCGFLNPHPALFSRDIGFARPL